MQNALSDLKVNVGRYVDLAETEDIIITKYSKPTAKVVRYDEEPRNLHQHCRSEHSEEGSPPGRPQDSLATP